MLAGEEHALKRMVDIATSAIGTLEGVCGEFERGGDAVTSKVDRLEVQVDHLEEQMRKAAEHADMLWASMRQQGQVNSLLAADYRAENEFRARQNRDMQAQLEHSWAEAKSIADHGSAASSASPSQRDAAMRMVEAAERRMEDMAAALNEAQSLAKQRLEDMGDLHRRLGGMRVVLRANALLRGSWAALSLQQLAR